MDYSKKQWCVMANSKKGWTVIPGMETREKLDGFDDAVEALGHRYRRRLLLALLDHNPQDDDDAQNAEEALGTVAGAETNETLIATKLVHNHLPKLEELGYIAWDRESGNISKGRDWDEIEPLLKLLNEHADELPDGWL